MARTALGHDQRRETQFRADFDEVYKKSDERWDIRHNDLSNLVLFAFQHNGLSKHRRKQNADREPTVVRDEIEDAVRARLSVGEIGDAGNR